MLKIVMWVLHEGNLVLCSPSKKMLDRQQFLNLIGLYFHSFLSLFHLYLALSLSISLNVKRERMDGWQWVVWDILDKLSRKSEVGVGTKN